MNRKEGEMQWYLIVDGDDGGDRDRDRGMVGRVMPRSSHGRLAGVGVTAGGERNSGEDPRRGQGSGCGSAGLALLSRPEAQPAGPL